MHVWLMQIEFLLLCIHSSFLCEKSMSGQGFGFIQFNRFSADYLPVKFNTCLSLQLSPQLVAFLHHPSVEVLFIGLADDTSLAMGAPSGVGQNKLGKNMIYSNSDLRIKYIKITQESCHLNG